MSTPTNITPALGLYDDEYSKRDEPVKAGDVIQYYHPIAVAGDPAGLRTTTVLSVRPSEKVKHVLNNGEVISDYVRIRRIKTLSEYGDQLIDPHEGEGDGGFYSIGTFCYVEGGTATAADAVRNEASRFGGIFNRRLADMKATLDTNGFPTDSIVSLIGGRHVTSPPAGLLGNSIAVPNSTTASAQSRVLPLASPPASLLGKSIAVPTSATASAQSRVLPVASPDAGVKMSDQQFQLICPTDPDPELLAGGEPLLKRKCTIGRCPGMHEQILICGNTNCDRLMHAACSNQFVMKKYQLAHVEGGVMLCMKGCYNKYKKDHGIGSVGLGWHNDGKNGRDDPNTSEAALLSWWMTQGNFSKFKGGSDSKGKSKVVQSNAIANTINATGVLVKRSGTMVRNKIEHISKQMKEAIDFSKTETGAGLQEGDSAKTFLDAVCRYCKWYPELIDVVADRSSFEPKVTTDDTDWDAMHATYLDPRGVDDREDEMLNADSEDDLVEVFQGKENENGFDTKVGSKGGGAKVGGKGGAKIESKDSTNVSTPKRNTPKKRKGISGASDQLLRQVMYNKLESQQEKKKAREDAAKDDVTKKVRLAKQFREMVKALGGDKIMAAKTCPEFKIFLHSGAKEELKRVLAEEAEAEEQTRSV